MLQQASVQSICLDLGTHVSFLVWRDFERSYGWKCEPILHGYKKVNLDVKFQFPMSVITLAVTCYQQCAKEELRNDFWLKIFPGHCSKLCSLYGNVKGDTAIAPLHNTKIQTASLCCLHKLRPNHSPVNRTSAPKKLSINSWSFSVGNLKVALLYIETSEEQYITLMYSIITWVFCSLSISSNMGIIQSSNLQ